MSAVVGTVTLIAVYATPIWRERQLAHQDIAILLQQRSAHENDELFLGHLGKRLNAQQRFAEALPLLTRAVGLSPRNAELRDEWAKAQMGTGHVTEAFGQLKEFFAANPLSADAPFLLGKFYVTQQAFGPARRALEIAVKQNPRNGEAWSLLAHCRIKMANNGGAIEALEKAVALRPADAANHLQLATLYGAKQPDLAQQEFHKTIELVSDNVVAHREYSRFLLGQGKTEEAEKEARLAVKADENDPFAHLLLGRCLLTKRQPQAAIPSLLVAASLAPNDPNPAESLRRAYRRVADTENAALWDKRFLVLRDNAESKRKWEQETLARPKNRHAHEMFAVALGKTGDTNGCALQYALAFQTTPDNPRVLVATARALNEGGFAKEALPLARRVRKATSMNPEAYAVLGDVLVNLGRLHEAAINYDQIRDWRAANLPEYQKKIMDAAARLNASATPTEAAYRQARRAASPSEAEKFLRESLAADPENARALRDLLRLHFDAGRREEAEVTAKRLMDLSPEDGLAHVLFCLLYLQKIGGRALTEAELEAINQHLQIANADASVASSVQYARNLLPHRSAKPKQTAENLENSMSHRNIKGIR